MYWKLKQEVIEQIRTDADLYMNVTKALDIKPLSLPTLLRNNHPKLTQKAVLQVISKHLKQPEKDLLEMVEPAKLQTITQPAA